MALKMLPHIAISAQNGKDYQVEFARQIRFSIVVHDRIEGIEVFEHRMIR